MLSLFREHHRGDLHRGIDLDPEKLDDCYKKKNKKTQVPQNPTELLPRNSWGILGHCCADVNLVEMPFGFHQGGHFLRDAGQSWSG